MTTCDDAFAQPSVRTSGPFSASVAPSITTICPSSARDWKNCAKTALSFIPWLFAGGRYFELVIPRNCTP